MSFEDKLLAQFKKNYNKLRQKKVIIFPYGQGGRKVAQMLDVIGIKADYIIDNNLSDFNEKIYKIELLEKLNLKEYIILVACDNGENFIKNLDMKY